MTMFLCLFGFVRAYIDVEDQQEICKILQEMFAY